MPKILIKEFDRTSPGTPGEYGNYSVLIAGFTGTKSTAKEAKIINPDENGVYEFTSATAFADTIGLVAPAITEEVEEGSITFYHYGNQMAYELLNMGYTVIYAPIDSSNGKLNGVKKLTTDTFWELFKDKASYDFRFISHGLLKSSSIDAETTANIKSWNDYIKECEQRLEELWSAAKALKDICESVCSDSLPEDIHNFNVDNSDSLDILINYVESDKFKKVDEANNMYNSIRGNYDGFVSPNDDTIYSSFNDALTGIDNEMTTLFGDIQEAEDNIAAIDGFYESDIIAANGCIANLAAYKVKEDGTVAINGRGDCVALIELDENAYNSKSSTSKPEALIAEAVSRMSTINENNGSYCALTVPSVVYKMADNKDFGNNKTFPGAFHYLACFMSSLGKNFAEWYAAAGYTRGVSSYAIDHTTVKLGEIAINALEPRQKIVDAQKSCNVIANFRGSYYLWGNRTAHPLDDNDLVASHFLNIRHLCSTIKKQLYVSCRRFTFDPNSDTLWFNFVNSIKPTLEKMKANQGVRDYRILKITTDKKATLKAKIRIIPIEAVEDFDIEVSLEDSFGETAVVTD